MVDDALDDLSSDFEPSCFYTGFNGPVDPSYANVARTNSSDPLTLSQAIKRPDWDRWEEAIQSELTALAAFDTFEVVDLPPARQEAEGDDAPSRGVHQTGIGKVWDARLQPN